MESSDCAPLDGVLCTCAFCLCPRLPTSFSERHLKKIRAGQDACCTECRQAIAALSTTAICASRSCGGPSCDDGVTLENRSFWDDAICDVVSNAGSRLDCSLGDGHPWIQDMLRRWIDKQLQPLRDVVDADAESDHAIKAPEAFPAWLEVLRAERIVRYDVQTFPFEDLCRALFETADLSSLHRQELRDDRPPLCPTLFRAYVNAGIKRPRSWRQSTKWEGKYVRKFRESSEYQRFIEVYTRFVQEVIEPLLGCGALIFQCPPTMRCQMPSSQPSCAPHRDADFAAHHGAEINFWLPVTQVWGSNSLHVESAPQSADFHPLEMVPGEMAIFNGSQCLHYTEANTTDSVRVSFDFRVLPKALLVGKGPQLVSKRNNIRGAATFQYEYLCTGTAQCVEAVSSLCAND